jgi:nickel superoxide dismutase
MIGYEKTWGEGTLRPAPVKKKVLVVGGGPAGMWAATIAHAHCDLPCGVYDPEQARIEAESCHRINEKYAANDDPTFRTRAVAIKEKQADVVKHHLDVLWHDYFKPEHLDKVPNLHELFWNATKQVSKVKASTDAADSQKLLDMIDDIDAAWKATGGLEKTRVAGRPG